MTTAHRPTFNAAIGQASDYGNWRTGGKVSGQFSVKDMPAQTTLKFRQGEQIPDFTSKDAVLAAEAVATDEKRKGKKRSVLEDDGAKELLSKTQPLLLTNEEVDTARLARKYDDRDEEDEDDDSDLDSSESEVAHHC